MRRSDGSLPLIGAGVETTVHVCLDYIILLPNYDSHFSRYRWAIYTLENGSGLKSLVAKGNELEDDKYLDFSKESSGGNSELPCRTVNDQAENRSREIRGAMRMDSYGNIIALEIFVDYWINKNLDPKPINISFRTS